MSTPTGPNTSGQPLPQPGQPDSQPGQPYPPSYGAGQVPPPGTYSVAGGQQPPGGSYFPPPPAGTDPSQPFPGQPVAPAKKKNPKWLWPLIAVAVVLVGVLVWFLNRDNVQNAVAGDCVVVESASDFKKVDCSSAEAEYKVLSVDETDVASLACSDPNVDVSLYTTGSGDNKSWCLQGLFKEGDCLKSDGSDKIDCATATSSDLKVLKVLEGTQDDQGCPADTTGSRPYTDANKVLCLATAK